MSDCPSYAPFELDDGSCSNLPQQQNVPQGEANSPFSIFALQSGAFSNIFGMPQQGTMIAQDGTVLGPVPLSTLQLGDSAEEMRIAQELAARLGGTVVSSTNVYGGTELLINVNGVEMNAGLLAQRYLLYPADWADSLTRAEVRSGGGGEAAFSTLPLSFAPTLGGGLASTVTLNNPLSADPGLHAGTMPPNPTQATISSGPNAMEGNMTLAEQVLAMAQGQTGEDSPLLSVWDWNWYFEQVTGSAITWDPVTDFGLSSSEGYDFTTWWNALQVIIARTGGLAVSSGGSGIGSGTTTIDPLSQSSNRFLAAMQMFGLRFLFDAILYGSRAYSMQRA